MPQLNLNLERVKKIESILKFLSPPLLWVEKHPVAFLLAFSFIIRLIYLSLQNSLWWDSYIYMGMGKFLLSQGNSGLLEIFRPPLHPLLLGLLWKAGVDPLLAGPVLDIIFSLLVVVLIYRIGRMVFDEKTALIAALLTSINPLFLMHTGLILTEPLAMALGLAAVYFFLKFLNFSRSRAFFLSGIFAGLSFLAKFPQGIIVLVMILAIFFFPKTIFVKVKECLLLLAGFGLITIPYFFWSNAHFGSSFAPLQAGTWIVTTATWLYDGGISYYFIHFFLSYPFFLLFWYFVYLSFRKIVVISRKAVNKWTFNGAASLTNSNQINLNWINLKSLFLVLLCFAALVYFMTVPRKEPRYLVAIVPYAALLSVAAARAIYQQLLQQKKPLFYPASFIAICVVLSIIFIPGALSFEEPAYPAELGRELEQQLKQQFLLPLALPILSSNPLPAAFTDNKIITLGNMEYAAAVYNQNKENAGLFLLTDCDLVCPPHDTACQIQKEKIINEAASQNQLIFHKTIKGCTTQLFKLINQK